MSEQSPTNNPLAIASLVCGIISLPMFCCCYGLPFNLLGLSLGIVAIVQINKNPEQRGKGMAIGGVVTSCMSILLSIAILVFFGGAMMLEAMDPSSF